MIKVAPSILSADFADMAAGVSAVESWGADMIHCDVMDGAFVPNMSFGPKMVADLRRRTSMTMDVHMMVQAPERYIPAFIKAGADIITVHQEATPHLQRALRMIKDEGIRAGAVLNPATSPETLRYVMDDVDMILLMSVNPGFGGQSFIPAVLRKISDVRDMITKSGRSIMLEVDGGVCEGNFSSIIAAGADVLVAGSALFGASDPAGLVERIHRCGQ